jgi:hypothetical protein
MKTIVAGTSRTHCVSDVQGMWEYKMARIFF